MGSASYLQAIKPDTGKISKLIENCLLFDWVIRIEYSEESESSSWQQWDESFFALRSANAVISALKDCYAKKSHCTIRINAEKVRPQTRMLYTAYVPRVIHSDAVLQPLDTNNNHVSSKASPSTLISLPNNVLV